MLTKERKKLNLLSKYRIKCLLMLGTHFIPVHTCTHVYNKITPHQMLLVYALKKQIHFYLGKLGFEYAQNQGTAEA